MDEAIQKLGIKKITGQIIANESIFDNQGTHPRLQAEDLGLSYAAGSYGPNVFDNRYKFFLKSGEVRSIPTIESTQSEMKLNFINGLTISNNPAGESIFSVPFTNERFLNGSVAPSPTMSETVKVTNHLNRNLFADALLKTIGILHKKTNESITFFDKGIDSFLILYDGSGLTPMNHRVAATFVSDTFWDIWQLNLLHQKHLLVLSQQQG